MHEYKTWDTISQTDHKGSNSVAVLSAHHDRGLPRRILADSEGLPPSLRSHTTVGVQKSAPPFQQSDFGNYAILSPDRIIIMYGVKISLFRN